MEYFVDFEGFYTQDLRFIVKAIAIAPFISPINDCRDVLLFKPPMESHNEVVLYPSKDYWGRQNVIPWETGEIEYEVLASVVSDSLQNAAYVYVLGEEKKRWLRSIIDSEIIDLSKMRYINYLERYGSKDQKHYACPYENAQRMREWFWYHWGPIPTLEKSLQLFYQLQSLTKMTAEDIACLDAAFILQFTKSEISEVWSKLPEHLQTDQRFIDYLKCEEHYISTTDASYKKDCFMCTDK